MRGATRLPSGRRWPPSPLRNHPSAVIAESASIDPTVEVGPLAVIGENVTIGPSPLLGQHREEILAELGYTEAEIRALAADGAI